MAVKFQIHVGRRNHLRASPDSATHENGFSLSGRHLGTVILVHGLTGTPHEMRGIGQLLNRKGYTVICPRLAHHGEPIEMLKHMKWQECYQSVRTVFLDIQRTAPARPVFASGLSMGALLALLLADEFPNQIAGVSCLSPTLFYDGWNMPWSKHLLPLGYYTPLKYWFYFKEEPPYGIKNEAIRKRLHRYYKEAKLENIEQVGQYGYPFFPVSLLSELHFLVKHLTKRLPTITTPVQLIQAEEDDMTSIKNSQFIYDRIRSNIKELFLLKNSYHIITVDQERDLVAQKMAEFFHRVTT